MALSPIQQQLFLDISGKEYETGKLKGSFSTDRPYNDPDWKYSPWIFSYVIELETGYFVCEIVHRMTNNRIYGWDSEGNELPSEITDKYFISHF